MGWIGLSAPAKTPEPILDKLSAEIMRILKEPEVLEKMKGLAFVPAKESRQEFEAYIAIENTKWRKIINDAGVKQRELPAIDAWVKERVKLPE